MKNRIAALGAILMFLLIGCILDGRQAGRGSEVENEVYGTLVDANGKPVQGARVKALPSAAPADTDSVFTDSKGRYAFNSLSPGSYNLLGDYRSGTLLVYIPAVAIMDSGKNLGTDTLRVPGSIRGRFLAGSQGKPGVLAVVSGLSRLELSDDSGRFQINGIPQGKYALRYSGTGFIIPQDTGIAVKSNLITVLPDKHLEYDPTLSPPEPIGLKAVYDTLNERVLLSWEAVPVSDLDGFLVYRDDPAFLDPQVVVGGFTKGTEFIDSTPPRTEEPGGREFVYRVRSRDLKLNKSINFSDPATVHAVSKSLAATTASIQAFGLHFGLASPGDSLRLVLTYSNPTRHIRSIVWYSQSQAEPLRAVQANGDADTLEWITGSPGNESFEAILTDDAGTVWNSRFSYAVLSDPPKAYAGTDQEVSISDSIRLQGSGSDLNGRVSRLEWSIEGGPYVQVPQGGFSFRAPNVPRRVSCMLRVTDDDGFASLDTVLVNVVQDAPAAGAGRDTVVTIGDAVALRGGGSDHYGRIGSMEWDIGAKGVFQASPDGRISFNAPAVPGGLTCLFRVRDDDGNSDIDTLMITVLLDLPSVRAGLDTVVSLRDNVILHGSALDQMGRIVKTEWDIGATGAFKQAPVETTFLAPAASRSVYLCVLRATDDDENTVFDTVSIAVLADAPSANAGADTVVSIGDTLHLNGTGKDGFGMIMKWDWSCGSESPKADGPEAKRIAPKLPMDDYSCVLKATDDDGQFATDTMHVKVVLDAPLATLKAGGPLEGFAGDTIGLLASASHDGFGTLVKFEWDLGTGTFKAGTRPDTVLVLPNTPGSKFKARLRVTDDDGNTALDSLNFSVYASGGRNWQTAINPTPFLPRYGGRALVFGGKLWVIAGFDDKAMTSLSDIWSSEDGVNWAMVTDHADFGQRYDHAVAAFLGRMWVIGGERGGPSLGDVWSSADGKAWRLENSAPGFSGRSYPGIAVFGGKLWLIGGLSHITGDKLLNDVWSTTDGVNWKLETANAAFSPRARMGCTVFGNKLWVFGGWQDSQPGDAWSSTDGKNWVQESTDLALSRSSFSVLPFADALWMMGGLSTDGMHGVYRSVDGRNWSKVVLTGPFPGRYNYGAEVYKGKMWLLSGGAVDASGDNPDVIFSN